MSTVTTNTNAAPMTSRDGAVFWRFVWKEFRMLRGLWLAVAIMGLVVQFAWKTVQTGDPDFPSILFATALAAAVLYAAGAAATTFSVEHEEETYDLLARLPATWWPVFAGKLLVTAASAVLLAALLSVTGWALHGPSPLHGQDASAVLGVLGVGIFEALAWGTFFSLIVRRPLIAAILTLVVGDVAVNIVVNVSTSRSAASADAQAYVDAIPMRVAIIVGVLACSAMIARRWLAAGAGPIIGARLAGHDRFLAPLSRVLRRMRQIGIVAGRGSRRRMLARLLWQTWRESWKVLLLPLGVGIVLLAGISAALGLSQPKYGIGGFVLSLTPLFVPALYGAMAFHADQRRGNYQFLAEHAARPRYVWFARHVVWLGSLVVVGLLITGIVVALVGASISRHAWQSFDNYITWGKFQYSTAPYIDYDLARDSRDALRIASLASFGGLVAYSVGQFCSMVLRSEILAAFLAVLLSAVVSAWLAVSFAWQLSGWLFLLPLFAGFMLATWFRAPDWIAGRNSLRAWWKPALAIITPLLLIGMCLPSVRLAQLPTIFGRVEPGIRGITVDEAITDELHSFQSGITPEARLTAEMYMNAAQRLAAGPEKNLLEPWSKWEYFASPGDASETGLDESKIPPDQLDAFHAAAKKQRELTLKSDAAAIQKAIEATERPACHFEFDRRMIGFNPIEISNRHINLVNGYPLYSSLNILLNRIVFDWYGGTEELKSTQSFDRLLAGLRMSDHLRSGQPFIVFVDQLDKEQEILKTVGQWAEHKGRTKDDLRDALKKLTDHFRTSPSPKDALLAAHLLVCDVRTGKDEPLFLSDDPFHYFQPPSLQDHLAYRANQLPWERERARRALDRITLRNVQNVWELTQHVTDSRPRELAREALQRWLRPRYGNLPETWEVQEPAAATSYLAVMEYKSRVSVSELNRAYCDNETCRRAALLRIALAAYRLDHKTYPSRLADLVPEYLKQLPLDPYSDQSFGYEPAGLSLPLKYRDAVGGVQHLEAQIPFFWSASADDVRLIQLQSTSFEAVDERDPEGAAQEKVENVYELANEEPGWWGAVLAFPLPK